MVQHPLKALTCLIFIFERYPLTTTAAESLSAESAKSSNNDFLDPNPYIKSPKPQLHSTFNIHQYLLAGFGHRAETS